MDFQSYISGLKQSGNFRSIPSGHDDRALTDFSTNDYLGLACRADLQQEFIESGIVSSAPFSSSASRLLASAQAHHTALEERLGELYHRDILLFNSGYHANTGLIPALTDSRTLIIADKLVHASIIDGIMLSKCRFSRFRHNDMDHLESMLERAGDERADCLVIVESIYSMDGDSADIERLIAIKRRFPEIMLYIDEAHAFGVVGEKGLGLAASSSEPEAFDVIVGTLGKAAASTGAFCAVSPLLRDVAVNRARSFIFSTALPPVNSAWTLFLLDRMVEMDAERRHLAALSRHLHQVITPHTTFPVTPSHIQPLVTGDAVKALELSRQLLERGFKVLPIRTPTVPPGTERLRFSLSAAMNEASIDKLAITLNEIMSDSL